MANDIVLDCSILPFTLPPLSTPILTFVSNQNLANLPSNCLLSTPSIGVQCIGNSMGTSLVRAKDPAGGASGVGTATGFGTYQVPIDLNALAAQGLNVNSGNTLYFQMIYRDSWLPTDPCVAPQVNRWTNSLVLQLGP